MDDPGRMESRQWPNFDPNHLKDLFRDHPALKLMDVLAERDAAIAERDTAMAEKKTAYAERDAALLQRDVAYADRNTAWMERDTAIAALSMIRANKDNTEAAAKLMQMVNVTVNSLPVEPISALPMPECVVGSLSGAKKQQVKKVQDSSKKRKPSAGGTSHHSKASKSSPKEVKQEILPEAPFKVEKSKQDEGSRTSLAAVAPYDTSSTSIPYCSCTGTNQQCYRWGSGGWQSACCTNVLSVYPLPMSQTKRGARVAGRKMSGGAFKKILERLAGDGVDITMPIDLKNHWAKHGTNRYVTIK